MKQARIAQRRKARRPDIGTGNKHYYFSLNKDKKTRLIYLGDKNVGRARQYSKSYNKLVQIVEKMSIMNMEILKNSES